MKKALIIMGTRPEAIKMCPLVRELETRPEQFHVRVAVTAQHREMLDQVLQVFQVIPQYDLNIMSPGQSLAQITARATSGLDEVFEDFKPDIALVQGDTTTAMVGALLAHYHRVDIGHVEAGLRTGNKFAPFPEEMNRRLIGQMADFHFPPTRHSEQVLLREGIPPDRVHCVGNTVIDALLWTRDRVRSRTPELPDGLLEKIEASRGMWVLVTGHRRESFGAGFENICQSIRDVADQCPHAHFVYPVHLNPNVREPVNRILGEHSRIQLVEPLGYEPFVWLMDQATIVLTDSGGVQEEAPSLGKPVLVMRDTTERPEGVDAGNARLVGTDPEAIRAACLELLNSEPARQAMMQVNNPYGDGTACRQIADVLASAE